MLSLGSCVDHDVDHDTAVILEIRRLRKRGLSRPQIAAELAARGFTVTGWELAGYWDMPTPGEILALASKVRQSRPRIATADRLQVVLATIRRLGDCTAARIAHTTGLTENSTRTACRTLVARGDVTVRGGGKSHRFTAVRSRKEAAA